MGRLTATSVLVAVAYYGGANLGFLLRFTATTPSVLWAPNTILTAALLLSPPRRWPLYLLAALPAHLLAELPLPWPTSLVLVLFVTNCSQAMIAAAGVRLFSDAPTRFDTLRRVIVFILAAGLAAPLLSSFPDAAAVNILHGEPYWPTWRTRFFSNALTELVLGPAIVITLTAGPIWIRRARRAAKVEAAALAAALVVIGGWAFGLLGDGFYFLPGESVVVLLLPLILLATVRFGPGGASLAMLMTSLIAIWASAHGRGPFADLPMAGSYAVLELQIVLTVAAIPLLCLAALIVERRQGMRVLADQLRLEVALSKLSTAFVRLPSHEMDPVFETSMREIGEVAGVDRVVLGHQLAADDPVVRYRWSMPGSDRPPAVLPERDFPWTVERLRADELVVFSRLEDLPAAAARDVASFRQHGVCSALIVPLMGRAHVRGALSLLAVSEREWSDLLVRWLRLVAEMFANALARKEAEDALRASELSKSAILASLSSAVAVLDREVVIIDVNASWRRGAAGPGGWEPGELGVGANLFHAWAQAARQGMPLAEEVAVGILAVLRRERTGFAREYSTRTALGQQWFAMSVVPLDRAEGGAVVSCTDVSELKRAELDAQRSRQELAHFTRVSTMGQLTASIAHELNQPLTGILANARAGLRFLHAVPPDLGELQGVLTDIVDDDKRAGEVIQRLRDILRKGEQQRVLLDLNVLVQDVVRLLSSDAIIRNVTVTLELDPFPVRVYGDRVELQQVALNLLLNAMEATAETARGEGAIVVTTANTPRETVHIAVRDSGRGVRGAPEILFEPFFTTKAGGMGMGLAIARSIVEGHGGVIWATDSAEGGAIFHVALPAALTDSQ